MVAVAYTDLPSDPRVQREADALVRMGANVTIVVPQGAGVGAGLASSVVEVGAPAARGQTTLLGQLGFMRSVRAWVKEQAFVPDVVHVHNMPDYLVWSVAPWVAAGSRLVLDVHDVMSELALHRFRGPFRFLAAAILRVLERRAWLRADHVITVHDQYRDQIVAAGVPEEQVTVVMNVPSEPEVWSRARRPSGDGVFRISWHGTVSRRTGAHHLVRALAIVRESLPEVRAVIVGGGDGTSMLREVIAASGADDIVEFHQGFRPVQEVIEIVGNADLAVVPNELSVYTRNILPVKLIEYASMGLPVVATELPLVRRYFDGAVHMVSRPEPSQLAASILQIAGDADYRTELSRRSRAAAAKLSWSRFEPKLVRAVLGSGVIP